ncbi:hypothetical protein SERLA73DRAFT_149371 [Serpula lacrymans var. lacrymans S7.3]|uniref:Uncharacterized protein n=1 Tax=Serpula lacrymans var. lacrymans (strain S7.3) TaxID=936435 RepID=F8PI97_SERL3|nr:hypothetical protein SERLA73DRAFT_149371 [Serpula lacrymans var. lacrymans S7.3]
MKRVLPRVRMVAPKSKSTNEEQEEIEGLDEILSDDEHGADVQNQPGPSKPAASQQTVAFQESTTRPRPSKLMPDPILAPLSSNLAPRLCLVGAVTESAFPDKANPLPRMVTRVMQSPTKHRHEEIDEELRNIAHRTRSGNSPVKQLQQAKDTKVDQILKMYTMALGSKCVPGDVAQIYKNQ